MFFRSFFLQRFRIKAFPVWPRYLPETVSVYYSPPVLIFAVPSGCFTLVPESPDTHRRSFGVLSYLPGVAKTTFCFLDINFFFLEWKWLFTQLNSFQKNRIASDCNPIFLCFLKKKAEESEILVYSQCIFTITYYSLLEGMDCWDRFF